MDVKQPDAVYFSIILYLALIWTIMSVVIYNSCSFSIDHIITNICRIVVSRQKKAADRQPTCASLNYLSQRKVTYSNLTYSQMNLLHQSKYITE